MVDIMCIFFIKIFLSELSNLINKFINMKVIVFSGFLKTYFINPHIHIINNNNIKLIILNDLLFYKEA